MPKATGMTVPASAETLSVALVGNPNTGKTTIFNRLTGTRQRIGNYPGITVERKLGRARVGDREAEIVDLPGAYSLAAASADEQIVYDVLVGKSDGTRRPELIVCVVDATNIARNLFLVSQIADAGLPMVIALNRMDAARRDGIRIDVDRLSERLGVPVVPTVAPKGEGIDELKDAIGSAMRARARVPSAPDWPEAVTGALGEIRDAVREQTGACVADSELYRMLFDARSPIPARIGWNGKEREAAMQRAHDRIRGGGFQPLSVEALIRYRQIGAWLDGIVSTPSDRRTERGYAWDRVLTHRWWGLLIFSGLMLLVFSSIYWFAAPLMDMIDGAFAGLGEAASARLASTPLLQSLVADGVIAGVGSVVIFLPQILILFFFIALLEDSGYMARAAFLMDKVFSWTGLNGKSFVPMLSSFACAVPAVMATRTIEDPRARIATVLICPLMSCSARLPVYVLMIGAFIQPAYGPIWAGIALFAMHLLGLFTAIPIAFVINRFLLKLRPAPFLLEMPPYWMPRLRDVAWRMFQNGKEFLQNAGTVIFAFSVLIWALTYFPRSGSVKEELSGQIAASSGISLQEATTRVEEDAGLQARLDGAYMEQSWLGRAGKFVQPIFAPAGFDWKITVGLLASFPARELIVSTFGIIYNVGGDADEESPLLRERLLSDRWPDGRVVFTPAVAAAIMVFFAFCLQCGSTVAVMAREIGWRWAGFAFGYMTALAWVAAVAVYRVGSALLGSGG